MLGAPTELIDMADANGYVEMTGGGLKLIIELLSSETIGSNYDG
jgi:hypothetical protein